MSFCIDCSPRTIHLLPLQTGQYFQGHVFMNFTVRKYGCEHWCLLENKCVSVNIGSGKSPSSVICELSDSDHCQHPKDLKPRQGWTYRAAKVSHVKLKRSGQISPLLSVTEVVWVLFCFCCQAKSQFYLSFYFPH